MAKAHKFFLDEAGDFIGAMPGGLNASAAYIVFAIFKLVQAVDGVYDALETARHQREAR